ncbi:MAG TPA: prepilin-type N-terminal cleavage/methylation domain-containing protein [Gemmatimonadales bacterium]|nr:prepilin-type N-terminal cleavage/methylation domain-containing protein [Gemmatimonadales bacterium]
MRPSTRGFTLVEMLIGLVLLALVSTTIYRTLNTNTRLSRAQTEQVSLQSAVRIGSLVVGSELKEMGINSTGGTDITAMSANGITYRAMRATGLACQVTAGEVRLRNSTAPQTFFSTRSVAALQDSLLLYVEGDPNISTDDRWLPLRISAVGASTCGAAPAIALTISPAITIPLTQIVLDAPVRTFEVMELGILNSGGQNWLGVRSVSAGQTLQPALGPITATGLQFDYYDAAGAVTANRTAVRSIQITVRGQTDRTVRAAGQSTAQVALDSLSTRITLRNAPHP